MRPSSFCGGGLFVLCFWFWSLSIENVAAVSCAPYVAPANGRVFPTTSRQPGQRVTISCNTGFALLGDGDEEPMCLGAQGYSVGKACQIPVSCGEYAAPVEAVVTPTGDVSFGTRVNISCNSGYVLESPALSTPICRTGGNFEAGTGCSRVPLTCLSSISTGLVNDGDPKYRVETCHPETQYCVTARAPDSLFVWRGCGPPAVRRGNESLVVLPEWAEETYLQDAPTSPPGMEWLRSHFLCREGSMTGTVELQAQVWGAGEWHYQCCCSHACNAGTKCIANALPAHTVKRPESSTLTLHEQCPLHAQGCYTVSAGGDATGWRLQEGSFRRIESIADPALVAEITYETASGRPPDFGEEFNGASPVSRAATDSWLSAGARVQFIDTALAFPSAGAVKAFEVYGRTPGQIRLQVWRELPPSGPGVRSFRMVEEKLVQVPRYDAVVTFEAATFGGPIPVEAGDIVGWAHTGPGVIEYDELFDGATSVYFLYGRPAVGDSADFSLGVKRAYSIRAYFDNATVRVEENPVPRGKGCYEPRLGRFGARCMGGSPRGAAVVARNASSAAAAPDLNVFLFEGALYQFSCCGDSMCNQEYCVRPADSCGPPSAVEHAVVVPNGSHLVFRQSVRITCNAGYLPGLLDLNATDQPMCQRDGRFDRGIQCFPIECGPYQAPEHSTVAPAWSLQTREHVTITCNAGYSLRGEGTRTPVCRGDGTFEQGQICAPSDYGLVVGMVIGFFALNIVLAVLCAAVVGRRHEIKGALWLWTAEARLWVRRRRLHWQGKREEDAEWEEAGRPPASKRHKNVIRGLWAALISLFSPSTVRGGGVADSRIRQGDFIAVGVWDGVGPLPRAVRRREPVGVGSASVNVDAGWGGVEGGEEAKEAVEEEGEGCVEGAARDGAEESGVEGGTSGPEEVGVEGRSEGRGGTGGQRRAEGGDEAFLGVAP